MSLRQVLGTDADDVHRQVDALLDSEDGLIVLIDRSRVISHAHGFGVSPCQLELLMVEVERVIRSVVGTTVNKRSNRRNQREDRKEIDDSGDGTGVRGHVGRSCGGRDRRVVDGRGEGIWTSGAAGRNSGSLLVVYFDWREKLLRRMLTEPKEYRKAA